jgi:DNA-binding NarL/FixJ family response regulator
MIIDDDSEARPALRLLLADDHAIVRAGYRHLLERQPDMRVVAEADNAQDAYLLYRSHRPDVFVTDISMPGASGLEALRRVREFDPEARVLVFSMHVSPNFALAALDTGACAYVTKSSAPEVLLRTIRDAMYGKRTLSPDIAQALALTRLSGQGEKLRRLSPREFEILSMLVALDSVEQIAAALHLSTKTVQNLHYQIKRKLEVGSDIELTRLALDCGLGQGDRSASPDAASPAACEPDHPEPAGGQV